MASKVVPIIRREVVSAPSLLRDRRRFRTDSAPTAAGVRLLLQQLSDAPRPGWLLATRIRRDVHRLVQQLQGLANGEARRTLWYDLHGLQGPLFACEALLSVREQNAALATVSQSICRLVDALIDEDWEHLRQAEVPAPPEDGLAEHRRARDLQLISVSSQCELAQGVARSILRLEVPAPLPAPVVQQLQRTLGTQDAACFAALQAPGSADWPTPRPRHEPPPLLRAAEALAHLTAAGVDTAPACKTHLIEGDEMRVSRLVGRYVHIIGQTQRQGGFGKLRYAVTMLPQAPHSQLRTVAKELRTFLAASKPQNPHKKRRTTRSSGVIMQRELVAQMHLGGPPIYDVIFDQGKTYIVMEAMDGDLGSLFDGPAQYPLTHRVRLMLAHYFSFELGEALYERLHKKNYVHGDLKLENILWDITGRVFPADFGGAQSLANGKVLGRYCTLSYQAPEVEDGRGYDQAADIWSLGWVFLDMLRGAYTRPRPSEESHAGWTAQRQKFFAWRERRSQDGQIAFSLIVDAVASNSGDTYDNYFYGAFMQSKRRTQLILDHMLQEDPARRLGWAGLRTLWPAAAPSHVISSALSRHVAADEQRERHYQTLSLTALVSGQENTSSPQNACDVIA